MSVRFSTLYEFGKTVSRLPCSWMFMVEYCFKHLPNIYSLFVVVEVWMSEAYMMLFLDVTFALVKVYVNIIKFILFFFLMLHHYFV